MSQNQQYRRDIADNMALLGRRRMGHEDETTRLMECMHQQQISSQRLVECIQQLAEDIFTPPVTQRQASDSKLTNAQETARELRPRPPAVPPKPNPTGKSGNPESSHRMRIPNVSIPSTPPNVTDSDDQRPNVSGTTRMQESPSSPPPNTMMDTLGSGSGTGAFGRPLLGGFNDIPSHTWYATWNPVHGDTVVSPVFDWRPHGGDSNNFIGGVSGSGRPFRIRKMTHRPKFTAHGFDHRVRESSSIMERSTTKCPKDR